MEAPELRFKELVNPGAPHPMVVSALVTVVPIFWDVARTYCLVTSMCDGRHRWDSFHYFNMAFDLRSKHLTADQKDEVLERMRADLGTQWDVILEARGETNEHFHIECEGCRHIRRKYLDQLQSRLHDKVMAKAASS